MEHVVTLDLVRGTVLIVGLSKQNVVLLNKIVELNLTLVYLVVQCNFRLDDSGVISSVDTGTKRSIFDSSRTYSLFTQSISSHT